MRKGASRQAARVYASQPPCDRTSTPTPAPAVLACAMRVWARLQPTSTQSEARAGGDEARCVAGTSCWALGTSASSVTCTCSLNLKSLHTPPPPPYRPAPPSLAQTSLLALPPPGARHPFQHLVSAHHQRHRPQPARGSLGHRGCAARVGLWRRGAGQRGHVGQPVRPARARHTHAGLVAACHGRPAAAGAEVPFGHVRGWGDPGVWGPVLRLRG
eukprot:scaffold1553_cov132-Isochrysis_galbana.AAC.6